VQTAEVKEAIGEVINLGTGQDISIGDMAKKIASFINRDIEILADEIRLRPGSSEVHQLCCNSTKAESLLAWEPKFSLDEGLRQTIEWLKKSDSLEDPMRYHV